MEHRVLKNEISDRGRARSAMKSNMHLNIAYATHINKISTTPIRMHARMHTYTLAYSFLICNLYIRKTGEKIKTTEKMRVQNGWRVSECVECQWRKWKKNKNPCKPLVQSFDILRNLLSEINKSANLWMYAFICRWR